MRSRRARAVQRGDVINLSQKADSYFSIRRSGTSFQPQPAREAHPSAKLVKAAEVGVIAISTRIETSRAADEGITLFEEAERALRVLGDADPFAGHDRLASPDCRAEPERAGAAEIGAIVGKRDRHRPGKPAGTPGEIGEPLRHPQPPHRVEAFERLERTQ
jgi:hypothetical protein